MAVSARPRRQAFGTGVMALDQVPFRLNARLTRQLWAWWLGRVRGRALAAEFSTELGFARGERTLMVGRDLEGECRLVASDRALHHRNGSDGWSRLGWEQITTVRWETAPGHLVVTGVASPLIVPLRRRGTWSELAQERITHTRLIRQQVMLDRDRHVVIEIRRCPATGELRWALVAGHHLDPGHQELRDQIERAATRLCMDLGLTICGAGVDNGL